MLSGGEKQKIACAGVSAMDPELYVLDEPTSNLDYYGIIILAEVIKHWKKQGKQKRDMQKKGITFDKIGVEEAKKFLGGSEIGIFKSPKTIEKTGWLRYSKYS